MSQSYQFWICLHSLDAFLANSFPLVIEMCDKLEKVTTEKNYYIQVPGMKKIYWYLYSSNKMCYWGEKGEEKEEEGVIEISSTSNEHAQPKREEKKNVTKSFIQTITLVIVVGRVRSQPGNHLLCFFLFFFSLFLAASDNCGLFAFTGGGVAGGKSIITILSWASKW